ncbi:MAG: DUF11 domain-containing protein [Lewinellaceae bacterium]|nr:DUF11 domain-containing protein [Saprospiraceae bacterium]MCB9311846.1 DUF11 domain-containing protein [Lewinellaceae bacterium]
MSHDTWGQIQVLQFKLVDESMTICGDSARVMIEFRKTTNDPVTGIQVELIPYRGMTYLPDSYQNYDGDATGDNGDPDNPLLFFPDLNGSAGETLRDTFEMKIGCQLLPLMANEKVLIGGNVLADGGIEAKATDIEVQLLQPALNLISIVNKVTDGTLDSSYTRVTTFKNGGFGSLKTWKYWSISQSAIQMDSLMYFSSVANAWIKLNAITLPGNGPGVEDTMCYLLQPAEFSMIGDGDATFDLNEEIKIREHFTVLECDPDNNRTFITGSWGCGGEECDWVMDEAFVRFGRILPNLKTWVDTWRPPFCHGTPEVRKIYITNLDGNPARDVILDLFTKYSTNALNGPVEMAGLDTAQLFYQIGANGPMMDLTPINVQQRDTLSNTFYRQWTGKCFRENPEYNVGFCQVELPEIRKNDTLIISIGVYKCCTDVCGSSHWWGWGYQGEYYDACRLVKQSFSGLRSTDSWTESTSYYDINGTSSSPPDVFHDEVFEYLFDFGSNSRRYWSGNYGINGYLEMQVQLPPQFVYPDTNDLDLKIFGPGANGVWEPSFVDYTNDLITIRYPFPQPFTTTGGFMTIPLRADCYIPGPFPNSSGGQKAITTQFFVNFSDDPNVCSPQCVQPLACPQTINTQLHCPGCDIPGMVNRGMKMARTSFGAPDNNADGLPDGSGSLDFDIVREDRAIEGDTVTTTLTGYVNANGGVGFMGPFDYGYARINIPRPDISFVPNTSRVRIYDASAGQYFTCTGLPAIDSVKNSGLSSYTFDFSAPTMSLLGCAWVDNVPGEGTPYHFDHLDSVWVEADLKICTKFYSGGPIQERTASSLYYLKYVPYATNEPADSRFYCDNYQAKYKEVPYATAMSGDQIYDYEGCTLRGIDKDMYTYYAGFGSNIYAPAFPGEHRDILRYDTIRIAFPKEYNYYTAEFVFRQQNGKGAGYQWWTQQSTPDMVIPGSTHDTLIYDLKKFYGTPLNIGTTAPLTGIGNFVTPPSNILVPGTEAIWMRCRIMTQPTCATPESELRSYWWSEWEKQDAFWCSEEDEVLQGFDSSFGQRYSSGYRQRYTFDPPMIQALASVDIARPVQQPFSWDVNIYNPPGATANNTWIYVENISSGIIIDSIYNLTNNVRLQDDGGNGIFKIGDFGENVSKDIRIFARTTNCRPDSVIYHVGWNCPGYPASFQDYSCQTLEQPLYVIPEPAELQMKILSFPVGEQPLCMPQYYEIELLSAKKGHLYDVNFQFSLPDGMEIVPGSFEMEYPAGNGSGYMPTAQQPVNTFANWYQLNISEQDPLLSSDTGFEGVLATGGENRLKLRFQVNTECGFTSGRRIRFFSWAYNACGRLNNYQFSPVQPYTIENVNPQPYFAQFLVGGDTLQACIGETITLPVGWISDLDPTGTSDSIVIQLPYGIKYVPGSFQAPDYPGIMPVVDTLDLLVNPDSFELVLTIPVPAGISNFDTLNFSVDLMVADEGLACQGFSIDMYSFIASQAVCDDGINAPFTCGVNAQTGFVDKLELIIEKPILAIGEVSGMITYNPPGEEMVDITIELNNSGAPLPLSVPVYLEFYTDDNGNIDLDAGDMLVHSQTYMIDIPTDASGTVSASFPVPAGQSCGLLIALPGEENCVCDFDTRYVNQIPYKNAGPDATVCSGLDTLLGLTAVAGYDYEWVSVFPANLNALSCTDCAQPTFNWTNMTSGNVTWSYVLRTVRNNTCFSEDTVQVTIYPLSYDSIGQLACPGYPTMLNGPLGFTNYQWDPTTLLMDPNDPQTVVTDVIAEITYTLSYTDANNCPGTHIETLLPDMTCADLSVLKLVNKDTVSLGDTIIYTIVVENIGPGYATGVQIQDILPPGVRVVQGGILASHGLFNSLQDLWNFQADTLYANTTATLTIRCVVEEIGFITNVAQITNQNETDPDSDPDDDVEEDDDYDYASFAVRVEKCRFDTIHLVLPPIFTDIQWYLDGQPISGATGLAYDAVIFGSYTVQVTDAKGNVVTFGPLVIELGGDCYLDYGDLPAPYGTVDADNGPSHDIKPDLYLGVAVDGDADGQPDIEAKGDDDTDGIGGAGAFGPGVDDEDGLLIGNDLIAGQTYSMALQVTNGTGETAYLKIWIDWNGDGLFTMDEEEISLNGASGGAFPALVSYTVPANAVQGQPIGVRVRLSLRDGMSPYGPVQEGEVEDYLIRVGCPPVCLPATIAK